MDSATINVPRSQIAELDWWRLGDFCKMLNPAARTAKAKTKAIAQAKIKR